MACSVHLYLSLSFYILVHRCQFSDSSPALLKSFCLDFHIIIRVLINTDIIVTYRGDIDVTYSGDINVTYGGDINVTYSGDINVTYRRP